MKTQKFLQYSAERDVVFVLGAGASRPDGVPLQRDTLPIIISGKIEEIENSEIGKIINDFIKDNFEFNTETNQFPQLEAVFGFLDYFIQQNESLNVKYSNQRLREIKEYLIKLIHYVVNLQTDKTSHYYQLFWNSIINKNPNTSIITLNYDTLLEQAFDHLFKKHGYIDYSIPFMNYEKLPQIKQYNFWVNPKEPVFVDENENPLPFKILKLHGSLNWKYCNCCNQTLLTPWDRNIDLNKGKFLGYTYPDKQEYEYICPIDGTEFQTLIVPPSYLKILHHPIISQLMMEASREIRNAKKIVFVGYSLSNADVHVKALFKKHVNSDKELIVINPKKKESLELNYKSLSKNAKFIVHNFEDFVNDESLLDSILL
ncbi:MAG: SIR2 family protein [Melioribacteraceae bacterium]|nr:SIR2 family protein [Melioribacteraceae bacterium]